MLTLIIGLLLFLVPHSIRIFADGWRTRQINQRGELVWQAVYSILSIIGLVLIVQGFAQARLNPTVVWMPPQWLKYTASVLLLPTCILLLAAYIPGTRIKSVTGHPMAASIKLWGLSHLLANGNLQDIILFGAFMLWAIFDYRASRRRDKKLQVKYRVAGVGRDIAAVVAGIGLWVAFAFYLHNWLFGVSPFG